MNRALFQALFPLPCHATRDKNMLFWRLVTQQETRIRYSSALSRNKRQEYAILVPCHTTRDKTAPWKGNLPLME